MARYRHLAAFVLVCGLSACGSAPVQQASRAYWDEVWWQEHLLRTVQSVVHTPSDTTPIPAGGIHGTVRFTFDNGTIENPEIVTSTGDPYLDRLMLQQVAAAQGPKPVGPHASEPHEFELDLDMPTPFDAFQYSIYTAIDSRKIYPKDGIVAEATGNATVDFDYQDGKASGIVMTVGSRNEDLNKSSIDAVKTATLPPAPQDYAGKPVHMEVVFCYSMATSPTNIINKCPVGNNVIVVQAYRIEWTQRA